MEAKPEKMETNPEMMQSAGVHREVPKEGVVVKSSGTTKKRHRGRNPAAGRRAEPKELTQGDCRSWRKLAAVCKKVSRHKRNIAGKFGLRELWTAEGIGRSRQEDDPLCKSSIAQGTRPSGTQSWTTVGRTGTAEESDQE
jgi:hypothetical protein